MPIREKDSHDLPCFEDFVESFGAGDDPDLCEQPDGDFTKCLHLFRGGRWETCPSGGLSPHREYYGPEEADDGS